MIHVVVPGLFDRKFKHLVLDYNGTLAVDGAILPGVRRKLRLLARQIQIHVVTADTFGSAARELARLPCKLTVVPAKSQDVTKQKYVAALGRDESICIGNGANDRKMLRTAGLGIAVIQREGLAVQALLTADVICRDILDALEILEHPQRLAATLRT